MPERFSMVSFPTFFESWDELNNAARQKRGLTIAGKFIAVSRTKSEKQRAAGFDATSLEKGHWFFVVDP